MQRFNNLPIRTKVLQIILGGMLLTVVLCLISFISYDYHVSRQALLKEISSLAEIATAKIAKNISPTKTHIAKEALSQLINHDSTISACVYSSKNVLIAAFEKPKTGFPCPKNQPISAPKKTHRFVHTAKLIQHGNQHNGALLVVSDLHALDLKLLHWLKLSAAILIFSCVIAYIMTWRMHKAIVEPALKIKTTMDNVRRSNNLSLRAPQGNRDEMGQLSMAFNELLEQMESDSKNLSIMYRELINKSTEAEANAIELEARSEYIKQMMSNAAHDLRQPLQAMTIFIDALQVFQLPEQPATIVKKINLAQNNLNQMFTDIISHSRLEDFDSSEECKQIHLGELFEKLHFEFEAIANKKGLELKTYTPNFCVTSAPSTLERIIRNLVSNAIRYTDTGGVLLGARKREHKIIIEVWDTGCGIPIKDQKSIFDRYGQMTKHQNGRLGGYGLGLAIVDHFAKTIDCHVSLQSQLNKGSCFKIHIPMVQPKNQNVPSQIVKLKPTATALTPVQTTETSNNLSGLFVYLIDDEQSLREALTLLFNNLKVRVQSFSSVNALKRYLTTSTCEQPDFILSDYQLGHDQIGAQAIALTRKRFKRDIPGIIMTGNTSKTVHAKILDHGYGLALKPLSRATLHKLLGSAKKK